MTSEEQTNTWNKTLLCCGASEIIAVNQWPQVIGPVLDAENQMGQVQMTDEK